MPYREPLGLALPSEPQASHFLESEGRRRLPRSKRKLVDGVAACQA